MFIYKILDKKKFNEEMKKFLEYANMFSERSNKILKHWYMKPRHFLIKKDYILTIDVEINELSMYYFLWHLYKTGLIKPHAVVIGGKPFKITEKIINTYKEDTITTNYIFLIKQNTKFDSIPTKSIDYFPVGFEPTGNIIQVKNKKILTGKILLAGIPNIKLSEIFNTTTDTLVYPQSKVQYQTSMIILDEKDSIVNIKILGHDLISMMDVIMLGINPELIPIDKNKNRVQEHFEKNKVHPLITSYFAPVRIELLDDGFKINDKKVKFSELKVVTKTVEKGFNQGAKILNYLMFYNYYPINGLSGDFTLNSISDLFKHSNLVFLGDKVRYVYFEYKNLELPVYFYSFNMKKHQLIKTGMTHQTEVLFYNKYLMTMFLIMSLIKKNNKQIITKVEKNNTPTIKYQPDPYSFYVKAVIKAKNNKLNLSFEHEDAIYGIDYNGTVELITNKTFLSYFKSYISKNQ